MTNFRIYSALLLASMAFATRSSAQHRYLSFHPDHGDDCRKLVGKPESDWVGAQRAFALACATKDLEIEARELTQLRREASARSPQEGKAFDAVSNAFLAYRALHVALDDKGCGEGNGCGSQIPYAEAIMTFDFLFMAEGFRGGGLPSFTAADADAADASLNAAWKRGLVDHPATCPPEISDTCIPLADALNLQRAWLRYRDAWLGYAPLRWPAVAPSSWLTYLTRQRIPDLN